ncbi:BTAD domain-containing putative transcriptional regulator [Streptosporangium sp. CA-115845]|uniref:AfsR/SARP family transcriptional regulator n=1 Tax=Streptosporangium sp. CA-115845 TaxID=3240071 RepID=UPI003D944569
MVVKRQLCEGKPHGIRQVAINMRKLIKSATPARPDVVGVGMQIRILGPVDMWRDGRPFAITGLKQRTLLGVLVLQANRTVSHDRLMAALWSNEVPATGRRLLHSQLWSLRRLLTDGQNLVSMPSGYSLQLEPGASDLDVFTTETALARTALSSGDALRASELFRRALSLWRGPALGGTRPELQATEGAALEERRVAALLQRIEADLALGNHAELISELRVLVTEHPLNEEMRGQLILALHRAGRTADALAEFQLAREYIRDEVGLEPGTGLSRIQQAVLSSDTALDAQPGVPARAFSPVPRQLPVDIARFTGRRKDLRKLDELLSPGQISASTVVISAIAGTAGVGKTALATHWAHRVAARFPDGQLYVNLHGYSHNEPVTGAQALYQFLRALGMPTDEIPSNTDERATLYRSLVAGRRMLMILDNAATPDQVRPLLPGSPLCRTVITSRDALRGLSVTHDVRTITLDVLSVDEAQALLVAVLGAERIDAEPKEAAELARLCGYLPLALKLAAAHLGSQPTLPLKDLVMKLGQENRLAALDIEEDPQVGVRAAFELSYRALPETARRTFRLISVQPGPDIHCAAVAVLTGLPPHETLAAVDALANAHLIHRVGDQRLAMHDLLGVYGRDRSDTDDSATDRHTALSRLVDWYLHTTYAAINRVTGKERELVTPPPTGTRAFAGVDDALTWLDIEFSTLMAIIAYAGVEDFPTHSWQITLTMSRFFYMRDQADEMITSHRIALSAVRRLGERQGEAELLKSLSLAYLCTGDYRGYLSHLRQALAVFQSMGDQMGEARVLGDIAFALVTLGEFTQAAETSRQSIELLHRLGNRSAENAVMSTLARAYRDLGRLAESRDLLRTCLAYEREQERRPDEAATLIELGTVHTRLGDADIAVEFLTRALTMTQELGISSLETEAFIGLGTAYREQGHHSEAIGHHQKALGRSKELRSRHLECQTLNELGADHFATGKHRSALEYRLTAMDIASKLPERHMDGLTRKGVGEALYALGRVEDAVKHWEEALAILAPMDVPEAEEIAERIREAADSSR